MEILTSDSTPGVDCAHYCRYRLQNLGWALKSLPWVFLQQSLQKNHDRLRHFLQLSNRQGCVQVLIHQLGGCASEWRLPSQHFPECGAQRVEVRADIHLLSSELFGASKIRGPDKAPSH